MEWWNWLWTLPLICGTAWFCTLFPLLVVWLADGRPVYPDQSNPYVAFISDIGAFRLQPLFETGSIVTGISYALTFLVIHFARYDDRMYARNIKDSVYKKAISIVGVLGALAAGFSLILLSLFDTYDHHEVHAKLLFSTFVGLAVSTLCITSSSLQNPYLRSEDLLRNRPYCTMCFLIVVVEVGLSVVFFACQMTDHMRIAGIFEWVITFLGVFYILALVGFTIPPQEKIDGERAPLLNSVAAPQELSRE